MLQWFWSWHSELTFFPIDISLVQSMTGTPQDMHDASFLFIPYVYRWQDKSSCEHMQLWLAVFSCKSWRYTCQNGSTTSKKHASGRLGGDREVPIRGFLSRLFSAYTRDMYIAQKLTCISPKSWKNWHVYARKSWRYTCQFATYIATYTSLIFSTYIYAKKIDMCIAKIMEKLTCISPKTLTCICAYPFRRLWIFMEKAQVFWTVLRRRSTTSKKI